MLDGRLSSATPLIRMWPISAPTERTGCNERRIRNPKSPFPRQKGLFCPEFPRKELIFVSHFDPAPPRSIVQDVRVRNYVRPHCSSDPILSLLVIHIVVEVKFQELRVGDSFSFAGP